MTTEEKQVRRTHSLQGQAYSGVDMGGITDKGVDTPQPRPMRESSEASPTYVGVHHAPNITDMDHISTDPKVTCRYTGIGLME